MILLLILIGFLVERGGFYYLGLVAGVGLFVYQQWLIRTREPKACFEAFLNNNQFGMVIFVGLLVDYLAIG